MEPYRISVNFCRLMMKFLSRKVCQQVRSFLLMSSSLISNSLNDGVGGHSPSSWASGSSNKLVWSFKGICSEDLRNTFALSKLFALGGVWFHQPEKIRLELRFDSETSHFAIFQSFIEQPKVPWSSQYSALKRSLHPPQKRKGPTIKRIKFKLFFN